MYVCVCVVQLKGKSHPEKYTEKGTSSFCSPALTMKQSSMPTPLNWGSLAAFKQGQLNIQGLKKRKTLKAVMDHLRVKM